MLPHVNGQQGDVLGAQVGHNALVFCLQVCELLRFLVVRQPAPPTTLDLSCSLAEIRLETLYRAKFLKQECAQITAFVEKFSTTLRRGCKALPEELMVEVTPAIKLDVWQKATVRFDVFASHCFLSLLSEVVQLVDVGSMMLAVVQIQKMAADDGLKRAKLIRQRLELNSGSCCGSRCCS